MSKLGIVRFDENGQFHTEMITVNSEELSINCWMPARFLGGHCSQRPALNVHGKPTAMRPPLVSLYRKVYFV